MSSPTILTNGKQAEKEQHPKSSEKEQQLEKVDCKGASRKGEIKWEASRKGAEKEQQALEKIYCRIRLPNAVCLVLGTRNGAGAATGALPNGFAGAAGSYIPKNLFWCIPKTRNFVLDTSSKASPFLCPERAGDTQNSWRPRKVKRRTLSLPGPK